jgi:hypothetical protein
MSDYEIRRYNTSGNLLGITTAFTKLTSIRTENTVGVLDLILPAGKFQYEDFSVNQIIEVWREKNGVLELQGETAYFLRDWEIQSSKGERLIRLMAYDANWLLSTRIVAYDAGAATSEMTDYADDMMKAIVTDALGGDAATSRQLSALSIASDLSASEELSKAFSRRNVLTVCQELAQAATEAGTNTYFDVVRTGVATFEFRTYTGQRGVDHGRTSGDMRPVGEQYGNFEDVTFGTYHSGEENYIYAGGQGEESAREIVEVSDSVRIADGYPFNRCEGWIDARHADTTALVTAEANAGLGEGKPRQVLTGRLVDTAGLRYGIDYGFGDVLSVEAFGYKVDCHVRSVRRTVQDGEQIDVRLKGEL